MYLCSTVDQVRGVSGFAGLVSALTSWDVSWDGFSLCHLFSHPQAGLTSLVLRECQDFKRGSRGMQGSLAGEAQHCPQPLPHRFVGKSALQDHPDSSGEGTDSTSSWQELQTG